MMYTSLAPYYADLFYDEKAIDQWLHFTIQHGVGEKMLEVACGCGDVAAKLFEQGVDILATDLSEAMAKEVGNRYPQLPFQLMDMTNITIENKVDTIFCYCDSVNYLQSEEALIQFFNSAKENLNENGRLLFDMHSLDRLKEFEETYVEEGITLGTPYQWTIQADQNTLHHHFVFYENEKNVEETHVQIVFNPQNIEKQLEKAGFDFEVKTDFDQDGLCDGEKYFYICRRR
ncbi:MAG: class I SAM-dependent DNA methyltransferase [Anaerorhabdus sp.]